MREDDADKAIEWMSSSREDLRALPPMVKAKVGAALRLAQQGGKSPDAKPLKGFGGAGVLEVIENHVGDTFRAVYTVKFEHAVYVLHVFQKKSKKGIATPQTEIELIKTRLRAAEAHHAATHGGRR